MKNQAKWNEYLMGVCEAVAQNSKCMSRKLGAILVRENSIVATGYNGPARGVPHCEGWECPRRASGYKSGEALWLCPAVHAEVNCITNAARMGVCTNGCTLYLNWLIPCKDCLSVLINAGVQEIVTKEEGTYGYLIGRILDENLIRIRTLFTK